MTTTYELYTNENGTPKAVEGKAPAILERVEALEGTLGNGVVTSVNGNTGDITPEQTGCLPLSGGTMTGGINFIGDTEISTTDDGYIAIYGGKGSLHGSRMALGGKDNAILGGKFELVASNASIEVGLQGSVDGSLKWGGSEVERVNSIGGKWIRYESGLQICWDATNVSGSSWTTVTYPVPFANTPNVVTQSTGLNQTGGSITSATGDISKTQFTVQQYKGDSFDDYCNVYWIAIGKWK